MKTKDRSKQHGTSYAPKTKAVKLINQKAVTSAATIDNQTGATRPKVGFVSLGCPQKLTAVQARPYLPARFLTGSDDWN
jgi:hypothetical protein